MATNVGSQTKTGKLIVIEGLDGSGKATQSQLLTQHLSSILTDRAVRKISFPDYENKSSIPAQMYLSGEIGTLDEIGAYAASSFYSIDRYISFVQHWKTDYEAGTVFVADRYTTSNVCHQMVKEPRENWDNFLDWLQDFEYNKLAIPKPDLVIYLDMHPTASAALLSKRYGADESKKDIHEANFAYLMKCREAALYGIQKLGWHSVQCGSDTQVLPLQVIAEKVAAIADAFLQK